MTGIKPRQADDLLNDDEPLDKTEKKPASDPAATDPVVAPEQLDQLDAGEAKRGSSAIDPDEDN